MFKDDKIKLEEEKKFQTYSELDNSVDSFLNNENPAQIDHHLKNFHNLKDDQKDFERQHLFLEQANHDRSSKLDFNIYESNEKASKYNKEIKNVKNIKNIKIQANSNDHTTSFNNTSSKINNSKHKLPAHIYSTFKNYSFLSKPNHLVSKSNQSSSITSIFPVQRKTTTSLLEKQLAWYELVGITMFNLFGSHLKGENNSNENKKFKNQTKNTMQSNVETVLLKPIFTSNTSNDNNQNRLNSSSLKEHFKQNENHEEKNLKNNHHHHHQENNQTLIKNLKQQRLPTCLIIGVRKAGTRAVLEYLSLNDHIKKADNEVHFFDNDKRYSFGLEFYRSQMPFSGIDQITIEKSPAYFITSTVPERIKAMNASIKLILIVRDPVTRLISDYTQLAHNKLFKLDDLIRTSGLPLVKKQQKQQKLKTEAAKEVAKENHLKFPIDKKKKNHLDKQPKTTATNEQSAFVILDEHKNNLEEKKKIEKYIDGNEDNNNIENVNLFATDYLNKIGSEPDYRRAAAEQQLDEIEQQDVEEDAISFLVKRQIRNTEDKLNKVVSNWTMFKNLRMIEKSIDFKGGNNKNSKIIDLDRNRLEKRRKGSETAAKRKFKFKINKQDVKESNEKEAANKKNRISRQAIIEPNIDDQQTDDEDIIYKAYKELNPDDEDLELGDQLEDDYYLSMEKQKVKKQSTIKVNQKKKKQKQQRKKKQQTNNEIIGQQQQVKINEKILKEHLKIPRFEELVIRDGEVNTNYKPVKTSIYSLYMDNWLRVSI